MSLPGNRLPPDRPNDTETPADRAELPPVWDRLSARWSWDPEQGYVCDDPEYDGSPAAEPGAIPVDRQPFFAAPPNEAQLRALALNEDER